LFIKLKQVMLLLLCLSCLIPVVNCAAQPSSKLELQLEKAPRLNESVELTCIRRTDESDIGAHEQISLKFERIDPKTSLVIKVPAEEVLISGNLNWEGDITSEPMEFSAILKFHHEGNWTIYAKSTLDPHDTYPLYFNIAEDASSFGWPHDYRPMIAYNIASEEFPMTVNLDIAEAPHLDEQVELTWSLNSIRNINQADGEVEFYLMQGVERTKISTEDILVDGYLTWEGSIKKDQPIELSATIKFPAEGDWWIIAVGHSPIKLLVVHIHFSCTWVRSKVAGVGWLGTRNTRRQEFVPRL
jgi:hypothetical protein